MATRTFRYTVATATAGALVAAGGLAALAVGTGTVDPPPRIAFVARSDNPADALAVGPTAGQLGAPVFVTAPGSLVPATQAGLVAYAPELVIIAGGAVAISPAVEDAIENALGLPDDKVVRAAGDDRHETAVKISELLAAHNPAYLPVDATAADADLLDGRDASSLVRVASGSVDNGALSGSNGSAAATTITAPTSGALVIRASADTYISADVFRALDCSIAVNGTPVVASYRTINLDQDPPTGTYNSEENCGTDAFVPVSAGDHQITFDFQGMGSSTHVDEAVLTVIFIPFGADGSPIAP